MSTLNGNDLNYTAPHAVLRQNDHENALDSFLKLFAGAPTTAPTRSQLTREQATEAALGVLTHVSDPDITLRLLKKTRSELRALEHDDEIAGALNTRLEAVLSTPWRFEPPETNVARFLYDELTPHIETILTGAFRSLHYGYSVMEAVYVRRPDGIALDFIQEKPFEWFRYNRAGELLYQGPSGVSQSIDTTYKFFVTRRSANYQNPYGDSILSRAYWPWYFRHNGWRFWMQYLDRFGDPLLLGKSSKPQAMIDALNLLGVTSAVAVGLSDELTAVTQGSQPQFATFDDAATRRIHKLILGQTLTTDASQGGSYAAANVHDRVRQDKRNADLRACATTMQAIANALAMLRFGANAELPIFRLEDGKGINAERAKRDADLQRSGVRFSEEYFYRVYDFEAGEITVTEPTEPTDPGDPNDDDPSLPDDVDNEPKQIKGERFAVRQNVARFTKQQAQIEQLVDNAIAAGRGPLSAEQVRSVISAARDPEDLSERLAALMPQATRGEFRTVLERALFAADVIGYVHAEGK